MRKKLFIFLGFLCVVLSVNSFVFAIDETDSKIESKQTKEKRFQPRDNKNVQPEPQKNPNVFQAVAGEGEDQGDSDLLEDFIQSIPSSRNVFQAGGAVGNQPLNGGTLKPDKNPNIRSTQDFEERAGVRFGYQIEELESRRQILIEQKKHELAPFSDGYYKRLDALSIAIDEKMVELNKLIRAEGIDYNPMIGEMEKDKPAGSAKVEEIRYQIDALYEERERIVDQYAPEIEPIYVKYSKLFREIDNEEREILRQKKAFFRKLERAEEKRNKPVRRESDGNGCQPTFSLSAREGIATGDQEKIEALDEEIARIGTILEKNRDKDPKNGVEPKAMARLITQYLDLKKKRADLKEASKANADKRRKRDGLDIKNIDEELKIIGRILEKNGDKNRDNDLHPETTARLEKRRKELFQIMTRGGLAENDFRKLEEILSSLMK